ncbi:MAG: glutathionylspermidine synthase family protein [Verrucomicrobiota bacterium]
MSETPWNMAPPLAPDTFAAIRRRTIFDCCKWDPQVGDVSILHDAPIVLDEPTWLTLSSLASQLADEAAAAERELIGRPDLQRRLGIPWAIRRALDGAGNGHAPPALARVIRFDFHLTPAGWCISEANTDVPGGYIEASGFTRMVAEHYPGCAPCGDPAGALADALAGGTPDGGLVGLVHATAYTDDRQVMEYLAGHLEARGRRTCLLAPDHLRWDDGTARVTAPFSPDPVSALVRFFPGEWLPNLPRAAGWSHFFARTQVCLCNPGAALLTQSKRFPLVWDSLRTPVNTWRRLLPETLDPREVRWDTDGEWVLKPAFGRVGEDIGMKGVTEQKEWRRIVRSVRLRPRHWVAQRRFEAVPLPTADGACYACVGVYTVDGKAAGAYGRFAQRPLIDGQARDAAVLVRRKSP